MVYIAVTFGVILISLLLLPFWVGEGGLLAAGSSVQSPDELKALKDAIIKRYLQDEKAHQDGELGKRAWDKRRMFLCNRYIDASRRCDFLEHSGKAIHS
jgi:hypothetical protein